MVVGGNDGMPSLFTPEGPGGSDGVTSFSVSGSTVANCQSEVVKLMKEKKPQL